MKNVEQLIQMSRKLTGNQSYDSSSGTGQDVFVQYLNNAKDSLISLITNFNSKFYKVESQVAVVFDQELYSYPTDVMVQGVDTIQWSQTLSDYRVSLEKTVTRERVTIKSGFPFAYIPFKDGVRMNPPLQSGYLWFTYLTTVKRLQKKAGQVTVATIAGGSLTALSVDASDSFYDESEINSDIFICVIDKYGNVKASNIEYTSVSAGVFTLSPFALPTGETVDVGDYILVGQSVVNIPDFPDICEQYLLKHMNYEAKYGDSSNWSDEYRADLQNVFGSISYLFAKKGSDITTPPIVNVDFMSLG